MKEIITNGLLFGILVTFTMITTVVTPPQVYAQGNGAQDNYGTQIENYDFEGDLDNTPCGGEIIIVRQAINNNFICTLP
jgi:hypothetical protein